MKKRFAAACFLLAGCASTMVTDSWKNPEFQGPLKFQKIAVMMIAKEDGARRIAEDELAAFIGEKAVPSYKMLSMEDLKNVDKVKAELQKSGADGLVVTRMINSRQEVNYIPGSLAGPYYSPWGYSSMALIQMNEPGYFAENTIARLETNIYSIADEKLLWSGASETFNPSNIRTEVKNLARTIQARLKKEGLLP